MIAGDSKFSNSRSNQHSSIMLVASAICIFSILLAVIVFFLASPNKSPVEFGVATYALSWAAAGSNISKVTAQKQAYTAVLFLLLLITVVQFVSPRLWLQYAFAAFDKPKVVNCIIATLAIFFFLAAYYHFARIDIASIIFSLLLLTCCSFECKKLFKKSLSSTIFFWTVLVVTLLPGVFVPLDLSNSSAEVVSVVQTHYKAVLGFADKIAAGELVFEKCDYGNLMPVILGAYERNFRSLSMNSLSNIIKYGQGFGIVIAAFALLRYTKSNYLATIFGLLMIVPCFHSNQLGVLFPNLSLLRSISLPITVAVLVFFPSSVKSRIGCYMLGILCGISLLYNLETGIVALGGILNYILFSESARVRRIYKCLSVVTGVLFVFCIFVLSIKVLFDHWFDFSIFVSHWTNIKALIDCGFSGLPLYFDPTAIVIVTHAAYVYISSLIKVSSESLTVKACIRTSVCVMILVWFSYFASRPHPENLHTIALLYCFLVVDLIRGLCIFVCRRARFPLKESAVIIFLVVGIVWIPFGYLNFKNAVPSLEAVINQLWNNRKNDNLKLSGVVLSKDLATDIWLKAEGLKKLNKKDESLVYISRNFFLISKLSGNCKGIDPLNDLLTQVQIDQFIASIKDKQVDTILVEVSTMSDGVNSPYDQSLILLNKRISQTGAYSKSLNINGWLQWTYRNPQPRREVRGGPDQSGQSL